MQGLSMMAPVVTLLHHRLKPGAYHFASELIVIASGSTQCLWSAL